MTPATERAREMRKALTPPEARMWVALKRFRARGYHFRRQVPFRGYFLDFACHSHRLVIEVDGRSHDDQTERDRVRDSVLAQEGYRTLRFTNTDVRDSLAEVLEGILTVLASRSPSPVAPSGPVGPHPGGYAAVPPHEGEGE